MSSNDNIQKCCGCIYQLYDFVVVDVYSSESAIVKCSIPSCHHICCCCHADSCQWVSSPDLVLNESSCLHCQLFECNNCCSTVASITTPFPAILSLLPNFHLYWFHPACWAHESFCILSFDDTNKPLNSSPLLQSLLATRYCPQCRKNLNITFFIYVEETLMQSEAFQELRRCLPATRIVVIQTHHKTTPLLKFVIKVE